jgi:hypothetical protein
VTSAVNNRHCNIYIYIEREREREREGERERETVHCADNLIVLGRLAGQQTGFNCRLKAKVVYVGSWSNSADFPQPLGVL